MGWFTKDKDGDETDGAPPVDRASLAHLASTPAATDAPASTSKPGPAQGPAQPASEPVHAVASVFGASVDIEGSLEGHGDVVLLGTVRGSIHVTGSLVIESSGRVQADVAAREVINAGTVEGNITAAERVRVAATGIVNGNIDAPSIIIDDGGGVEGFIQMEPPGGEDFEDDEEDFIPPPPVKVLRQSEPLRGEPGRTAPPAGSPAHPNPGTPAHPNPGLINDPGARKQVGPAAGPEPSPGAGSDRSGNGGHADQDSPFPSGDSTHLSLPEDLTVDDDGPLVLGGPEESRRQAETGD